MLQALDHLYLPGALTLWCAVFFGLATLWGYAQSLHGDAGARTFARRGYFFFTISVVLCAFVLWLALVRRDFRIEYVYQFSGLELPVHYQLAAFWAGQKGSFLVWLFWGALIGLPLMKSAGRDEARVMSVYVLTLFGLLFILVRENPFVMLDETPLDGAGLNPLLQDDWMVIHPPIMFVGYALGAVPFSFAIAALWQRDVSRWATRAFPWALAGFMILGTAILMGGYWAYKTLGWGGYWGWDPVENASLIPWLFGVVLIHGLYLERTRGRYRRINLVLASAVFLSVLYSTYLTRSGVLADFSVHSFVELGISEWLVLMQVAFLGMSVYLIASRWKQIETRPNEDVFLSRGAFLVFSTITVTVCAVVIAAGTSAPLLTAWREHPGQVGPSFYNRTNLPLALLLGFLLSVVPFLTWKGTTLRELLRKLLPAAVVAATATGVAAAAGVDDLFHLFFVFLAVLALTTNLQKTVARWRNRGMGAGGGYLAHVGVGVMLIGILASSAYDKSAKLTIEQGKPTQIDDLTITFKRYIPRQGREKERLEVEVTRADGFRHVAYPKLFVNDRTRQLMAHPDVKTLPLMDLYISPIQYDPGEPPEVEYAFDLKPGESARAGDLTIRFAGFDLQGMGGDATARLASGQSVTVGARLEVSRDGETTEVAPVFVLDPSGRFDTPPVALPGGALAALASIDPTRGTARIELAGVDAPLPAPKLSLDVTRKPLIQLVWGGLYVILLGGLLSTVHRLRDARRVDRIADRLAARQS
ncbi:MAG: hypothetical protein D6696_07760 [Acidobacteria bacterium]|nr:MAG: hypothetical protein D6696_07760 [Acidobacteriota bacterium]